MANVTLRNMPDKVYEGLKRKAERNRRSLNQEAIVLLAEAVERETDSIEDIIAEIDAFRLTLSPAFQLTNEEINRFKRAGRE